MLLQCSRGWSRMAALRVWGQINLYRPRWTIGKHWLKTKQNLGVITIIKINYNKQTVIISVVSVRARSCMHGRLRESQYWILVWTSSFPHGVGGGTFHLYYPIPRNPVAFTLFKALPREEDSFGTRNSGTQSRGQWRVWDSHPADCQEVWLCSQQMYV